MDASLLAGWDNFYVITGSAAGGLTGLTFVVIALITDARRVRPAGLNTFVTPTIVHFCIVLALAAYLSMPSQQLWTVSAGFGIAGAVGLGICTRIAFGLRHMPSDYMPVWEDWLWNLILPAVAYGALLLAADLIWHRRAASLTASPRFRCCSCSSAFTMPGTLPYGWRYRRTRQRSPPSTRPRNRPRDAPVARLPLAGLRR